MLYEEYNMEKRKQIKICHRIRQYLKRTNFWQRMFDSLVIGIVAAVMATAIINSSSQNQMQEMENRRLLKNLGRISIGCNKEWMDSAFGIPLYTSVDELTREDVYFTDLAVVRAFWGVGDESCKMFFVTKITDKNIPFAPSVEAGLRSRDGEKPMLGTVSYGQIENDTYYIFDALGFYTNGSGRAFYGEAYSAFYSYRQGVYFASVDYGLPSSLDMMGDIYSGPLSNEEMCYYTECLVTWMLDSEEKFDFLDSRFLLHDRNAFSPNTYGQSMMEPAYTMEKMSDYFTFNSSDLFDLIEE